jgi:hypothetical protein
MYVSTSALAALDSFDSLLSLDSFDFSDSLPLVEVILSCFLSEFEIERDCSVEALTPVVSSVRERWRS